MQTTMKKVFSLLMSIFCFAIFCFAQQPIPAKKQTKSILLMNGTAHLGNGSVIENSLVGFKDGKITLIGDAKVYELTKVNGIQQSIVLGNKFILQ